MKEIIEYLSFRPEIKILKVSATCINEESAKLLVANTTFKIINTTNTNDQVSKILVESDPVKKANYGIESGLQTEVPSLKSQSLFTLKKFPQPNQHLLPVEVREELAQLNPPSFQKATLPRFFSLDARTHRSRMALGRSQHRPDSLNQGFHLENELPCHLLVLGLTK